MTSMTPRDDSLQALLDAAQACLRSSLPRRGAVVGSMIDSLFARLATEAPAARPAGSTPPPALRLLAPALDLARQASPAVALLADRLEEVAPRLHWKRTDRVGEPALADGYAGAILVGADGLETRDDVRVGVSLMAPGVTYPDHRHPPEEIYIALAGGEWRQNAEPWHAPGPGGLVHNPPNVVHAMRATREPLLAIWFLLVDAS